MDTRRSFSFFCVSYISNFAALLRESTLCRGKLGFHHLSFYFHVLPNVFKQQYCVKSEKKRKEEKKTEIPLSVENQEKHEARPQNAVQSNRNVKVECWFPFLSRAKLRILLWQLIASCESVWGKRSRFDFNRKTIILGIRILVSWKVNVQTLRVDKEVFTLSIHRARNRGAWKMYDS